MMALADLLKKVGNALSPVNTSSPYLDKQGNISLPDSYQGLPLEYAMERRIYTPAECVKRIGRYTVKRGDILTLMREPTNTYDHSAIAVYHDGKKLGYLYQNGTRDHVSKYMGAGKEYLMIFGSFSDEVGDESAHVHIGLYGYKQKKSKPRTRASKGETK